MARSHAVTSSGCGVIIAGFRRRPPCVLNSNGGRSIACTHSNSISPIERNPTGEIAWSICERRRASGPSYVYHPLFRARVSMTTKIHRSKDRAVPSQERAS